MLDQQRILIVDDNQDITEFLRMRLEANDYGVSVAANGQDGIARAKKTHPDLILLDIKMPGIDGIETLRRLKSEPQTKDIPVVMLTAESQARFILAADKLGSKGFLIKPCHTGDLLHEVRDNIQRSSASNAVEVA